MLLLGALACGGGASPPDGEVLARLAEHVAPCAAEPRPPGSGGRVELAWTVRDGRASNVHVRSNDTGDAGLARCAVHRVSRWSFPPDAAGEMVWPFTFGRTPRGDEIDVTFAPVKPSFVIGEPVWIDVRFANRGPGTFHQTQIYNAWYRGEAAVEVTGPDGDPVPDPFNVRHPGFAMNATQRVAVAPGASGAFTIDLNRFAWLDQPGSYEVRLTWPWPGDPKGQVNGTFRVTMTSPGPDEARAVVNARPAHDDDFFEGLGHAVYVPLLEELARETLDERAIRGLGACPCPEATRALLRLGDGAGDARTARLVGELLARRLPDPGRQVWAADPWLGPWAARADWFSERALIPEQEHAARQLARSALAAPVGEEGWVDRYVQAAELLARIGTEGDAPALVDALDRVLGVPETGPALPRIVGALRRFRSADLVAHTPAGRQVVALLRWDGTGEPPPGWDAVLEEALASPNPQVLPFALGAVPAGASTEVRRQVARHLVHPDRSVALAALRTARRLPDPGYREPLLAVIRETHDRSAFGTAWDAAGDLGVPLSERMRLAIGRLGVDGDDTAFLQLFHVFSGCRSHGGGTRATTELQAAWTELVDAHHAAIDAGQKLPIDGGAASPDLVPPGFVCTRENGETWP